MLKDRGTKKLLSFIYVNCPYQNRKKDAQRKETKIIRTKLKEINQNRGGGNLVLLNFRESRGSKN